MKLSTTYLSVLLLGATLFFGCLDASTRVPPAPTPGNEVSSCSGQHRVFINSGNMVVGRANHTATVLPDGKILFAGGYDSSTYTEYVVLDSSEIYDPSDHSFQESGKMTSYRSGAAASRLLDGRILITGGFDQGRWAGPGAAPRTPLKSTEIFDPASKTFTAAASMLKPRYAHSSVTLKTGKILIAGGSCESENFMGAALGGACAPELYDAATGKFSLADPTGAQHDEEKAIALANGNVLLFCYQSVAEIYDPHSGKFHQTGDMPKRMAACRATVLKNGRVLILGATRLLSGTNKGPYWEAQIYDPTSGKFSQLANPAVEIADPIPAAFDDNKALVAGTVNPDYDNVLSSQIFDSTMDQFSLIGAQHPHRNDFTATTLLDGTVLIAGGMGDALPYADRRAILFCR